MSFLFSIWTPVTWPSTHFMSNTSMGLLHACIFLLLNITLIFWECSNLICRLMYFIFVL
jgi:hypothetical protein